MNVVKQSNSSNCGVLAIAYAFDICSGFSPCSVEKIIRQHLVTCLENSQFKRFPVLCEREVDPVKCTKRVDLHCT